MWRQESKEALERLRRMAAFDSQDFDAVVRPAVLSTQLLLVKYGFHCTAESAS